MYREEMIEILVIGLIIYFWVIKKKNNRGLADAEKISSSASGTMQTTTAPAHRMQRPGRMSSTQQHSVWAISSAQQKPVLSSSSTRQGQTSSGSYSYRNTASDIAIKQSEGASGSTTAYLNEKARQDAIEHAKEEREEQMRLNKAYGGLRVAERLYLGDSIPQEKRLCICGYCGAENLLPQMARERFCCYFCRESLG